MWTSADSDDHHLVLSSAAPGQTFYCLDYRDRAGDIEGHFTRVNIRNIIMVMDLLLSGGLWWTGGADI